MFKIEDGRSQFYQWDSDRRLVIEDPGVTQVHFCNRTDDCSLVCDVYTDNGLRVVDVPNILLQTNWRINVYAYDKNYTKHYTTFNVATRSKPADYAYTETEVHTWERLEAKIDDIDKNIATSVENYLNENPVEVDLSAYATTKAVEIAIAEIELTPGPEGPQGPIGDKGEPGYTPVKGIDYFDGATGPKGDKGDKGNRGLQGIPGADGKDGYTPIKGVDYFDGTPGKDGKDGAAGEKGEKGDPGIQGEQGPAGEDGISLTHSWTGTILTITSASGTSSANLKGEKGDKGDTGATGATGPKGDTGATGSQGPKGDKGDKGDTGPQGPAGVEVLSDLGCNYETWTFELEDGSTVNKKIVFHV